MQGVIFPHLTNILNALQRQLKVQLSLLLLLRTPTESQFSDIFNSGLTQHKTSGFFHVTNKPLIIKIYYTTLQYCSKMYCYALLCTVLYYTTVSIHCHCCNFLVSLPQAHIIYQVPKSSVGARRRLSQKILKLR